MRNFTEKKRLLTVVGLDADLPGPTDMPFHKPDVGDRIKGNLAGAPETAPDTQDSVDLDLSPKGNSHHKSHQKSRVRNPKGDRLIVVHNKYKCASHQPQRASLEKQPAIAPGQAELPGNDRWLAKDAHGLGFGVRAGVALPHRPGHGLFHMAGEFPLNILALRVIQIHARDDFFQIQP